MPLHGRLDLDAMAIGRCGIVVFGQPVEQCHVVSGSSENLADVPNETAVEGEAVGRVCRLKQADNLKMLEPESILAVSLMAHDGFAVPGRTTHDKCRTDF
jgi:hypothetical protein